MFPFVLTLVVVKDSPKAGLVKFQKSMEASLTNSTVKLYYFKPLTLRGRVDLVTS